jgi:hypothetical protein
MEWSTPTMELNRKGRPGRYWALILKAGTLSAILATVIAALVITLLSGAGTGNGSPPRAFDLVKTVVLLSPITAVSCGSFGFLAGVAGSTWIYLRSRHIRSTKRLLVESAIAAPLLGGVFPLFDATVNSPSLRSIGNWINPSQFLLCVVLSIPCALICAFFFRKRFIG